MTMKKICNLGRKPFRFHRAKKYADPVIHRNRTSDGGFHQKISRGKSSGEQNSEKVRRCVKLIICYQSQIRNGENMQSMDNLRKLNKSLIRMRVFSL